MNASIPAIPIKVADEEFLTLDYRNNVPYIRWVKSGRLVVDRPAYGAEELLLKRLLHLRENLRILS